MGALRWLVAWAALGLSLTAPAYVVVRAGLPAPAVNVRWSPDVGDAERAGLEQRFGLTHGIAGESLTWSYQLENTDRSNVSALVKHPGVVDTHKINRATFEVEGAASPWRVLRSASSIGFALSTAALLAFALRHAILERIRRARAALPPAIAALKWYTTIDRSPPLRMEPVARWETVVGVILGFVFLRTLLVYGPFDVEESGLGFFSSQVFYRNLFAGRWPFWFNALGFGTPMPIGQRFDFHPAFALGSLISLRAAVSAMWVVHVIVMTVYFRRFAAILGIGRLVRTGLTACYLFSLPSMNYFHSTDWLSVAVGWSFYPVLAYHLHRTVLDLRSPAIGLNGLRLGFLAAFWLLNAHPGYIPPLAIALALYTVLIAPRQARVYGCLVFAAGLCAIASSERLYFLLSEARFFSPSLPRNTQAGYTLYDFAFAAAVPFTRLSDGGRQPFIGIVIGMAALVSVIRRPATKGAHPAGVVCLAAAGLTLLPLGLIEPLKFFSAIWFFRDPMVFFGLLAAGVVLQRTLDARPARGPAVIMALLGAQVLQQGAAVRPAFELVARLGGPLHFYRDQQTPTGLGRLLVDRATAYGPRIYTPEDIRQRLRGTLSNLGIHAITDLSLWGLDPINGWFKNVSTDRIHPSWQHMHGMIPGQRDVVANQPLLNVLGIDLVLAAPADGPFATGLVVTDRQSTGSGSAHDPETQDLMLLANPHAWPRAVLLRQGAEQVTLARRPACEHQAALCRDFTPLEERRLPDQVRLVEDDGHYTASFPASRDSRVLFVSAMYRPEWRASSPAGPLRVEPAADAFLSVIVPPGVEQADIRFTPRARVLLSWVAYGTMLTLLAAVCAGTWRDRRRAISG